MIRDLGRFVCKALDIGVGKLKLIEGPNNVVRQWGITVATIIEELMTGFWPAAMVAYSVTM